MSKLFRDLFEQAQAPDPAQAPAPTPAPPRPYRAAIAYAAELHWPVILLEGIKCIDGKGYCTCGKADCPSPGKHPPAGEPGVSGATTDLALIKTRFGARPWANVGIATGAILGLDVDPRHGGDRSLTALERVHGPLPVTVTARTGGGGRHILFQGHPGITNSIGKLGPGLDVKSHGGYLVAPPSVHVFGTIYEWLPDRHPLRCPIAPLPDWLMGRLLTLRATTDTPASPLAGRRLGALLTKDCLTGHRNETLARLANYHLYHRLNVGAVIIHMTRWSEACCKPPLDPDEIARTVRSMARYRAQHGRRRSHAK